MKWLNNIWILLLAIVIAFSSLYFAYAQQSNVPQASPKAAQAQVPATAPSQSPTGQQPSGEPPAGTPAPPQTQSDIATKLQVFVYPAKGQPSTQQSQDEQQCFEWAQSSAANQAPATTAQADSSQQKSGAPVAGGAAKGAAAGAAIGAIAGDAGEGAAIGATGGAMGGARNRRKAKKEAEKEKQAQQSAQQQQATDSLRRAFGACMEPKGYSVK
ncbi:MAG TPA: glycine zipper domain-containing protein [Terriglobales bacterium]|jgi:hypothetical protein